MKKNEKPNTSAAFRATFEAATGDRLPDQANLVVAGSGLVHFGATRLINSPSKTEGDENAAPNDEGGVRYETVSDAFEAIKSELTEVSTTKEEVHAFVAAAVARAAAAREIQQEGYAARLMAVATATALEAQAIALGFNTWVSGAVVDRVIRDRRNAHLKLDITSLAMFPRAIPADVAKKVKALATIFDGFVIVFTNPTKEVINPANKDPILFGTFRAFPDRLYYIVDWVDAYCDITLDKFTKIANDTLHDEWKVNVIKDVTDEDIAAMVAWSKDNVGDFGLRRGRPIKRSFFQKVKEFIHFFRDDA